MSETLGLIVSRLIHEGGTKFYNVISALNKHTNESLLITHWGKVSTHGQIKIEKIEALASSVTFMHNRAVANKTRSRGYKVVQIRRTPEETAGSVMGWIEHNCPTDVLEQITALTFGSKAEAAASPLPTPTPSSTPAQPLPGWGDW